MQCSLSQKLLPALHAAESCADKWQTHCFTLLYIALHCFTKREEQSTTLNSTRVCGVYKRPLEMSLEAGFTATPPMCPGYSLQEIWTFVLGQHLILFSHPASPASTKTARKLNFLFSSINVSCPACKKIWLWNTFWYHSSNVFCCILSEWNTLIFCLKTKWLKTGCKIEILVFSFFLSILQREVDISGQEKGMCGWKSGLRPLWPLGPTVIFILYTLYFLLYTLYCGLLLLRYLPWLTPL